jgi:tRNA pseudouridine55 synthase
VTLSGLLRLDKPAGPTSHDIVAIVRRQLGVKRVGHTGTLDPFASGLLLVCVGTATRLVEYFHALPKTYEATIVLGDRRDTDDLTGEQVARSDRWEDLSRADVARGLAKFLGSSEQIPPDYSARQVGGRRAYDAARQGDPLELEPRPIEVFDIELLAWSPPSVAVALTVSTGTYIRAIARDLGEDLGCHAHLSRLRRARIGPFDVEDASSPADLNPTGSGLISPLDAVGWMPQRVLEDFEIVDISTGRAVPVGDLRISSEAAPPGAGAPIAVSAGGELAAIAIRDGDVLKPTKVFCAA